MGKLCKIEKKKEGMKGNKILGKCEMAVIFFSFLVGKGEVKKIDGNS